MSLVINELKYCFVVLYESASALYATVAQSVEQLIRNQQVCGS